MTATTLKGWRTGHCTPGYPKKCHDNCHEVYSDGRGGTITCTCECHLPPPDPFSEGRLL